MRWIGLGVCLVAAIGCRTAGQSGATPPGVTGRDAGSDLESPADAGTGDLGTPADAGRGDPGAAVDAGPRDIGTPADAGPGDAGAIGTATADAGDAGEPLCPPLAAPATGTDVPTAASGPPTAVPFSCAPMPSAFFFPRPGPDVPGAYARCASFADARASSLVVDRDGSRVALIGIDGVARIVDVASRTVIGVLAPPRASVGLAAFSPSGGTILTVARGERQVTLWRADTFAPIWTATLPGHTYQDTYNGAAAFSPDGTAALVSPGGALYLLDVATGVIRATSLGLSGVVLDAGYGWKGRRIAVLTSPLDGMCVYSPHGGSVTILDPNTLLPIVTPMIWPQTGDESPGPGQLLVAADADVIVTSGLETYPVSALKAFRLSDGGPLPAPAIATFPLALSPDGTTALMTGDRTLELVRLEDGTSIASTAAAAPTAVAFSGDGSTVAAGSTGDNLLGIWRPAAGPLVPTCTADARLNDEWNVTTSLSADGATLAVDWGPQIRVLRCADGATVSTIDHHPGQTAFGLLQLSPDARYLIAEFYAPQPASVVGMSFPVAIFRTSDGAKVADLGDWFSFQGGSWSSFAFQPDGRRLDGWLYSASTSGTASGAVMEVDLETGTASPKLRFEGWGSLIGLSGDCPLLLDPVSMTLVRSCGGCQPLPLAKNTRSGVVSLDGSMYLSSDGDAELTGTVLWNIASQPGVVRSYPPRPEEAVWNASETPVAVSAHGGRVVTGAQENASCSWAPGFTSRVHDVATDTVIDDLPPRVTSASADLGVIAYGPVLWCAR